MYFLINVMIEFIQYDVKFKLGKNALDNFKLIDEANDIDDTYWWFHLDRHPSGHCIVHTSEITNEMIKYAGQLVKDNSKLRTDKDVKIIYTQIKNIKKNKTIGEVSILTKPNIIKI